jgi:Zn-dependent metalloprotease
MTQIVLNMLLVSVSTWGMSGVWIEQQLMDRSITPAQIEYRPNETIPYQVKGYFPYDRSRSLETVARQFMQEFFWQDASVFDVVIYKQRVDTLKQNTVVRFQQTMNGIPIFGSSFVMHITKDNAVVFMSGRVTSTLIDTAPTLSSDRATQIANQHLDQANEITQSPELIVYAYDESPQLTWHLILSTTKTIGSWHYFIDAHSGNVVAHYNAIPHATKHLKTYSAIIDAADPPDDFRLTLPGNLGIEEINGGPITTTTNPRLTIPHQYVSQTYDYFLNHFGMNSYNNSGATVITSIMINDTQNYFNARWDGNQMFFGNGGPVDGHQEEAGPVGEALDMVAHEYCHAITEHSAGLVYWKETGALNESISDVCGILLDPHDWKIGEDSLDNPPARDMQNPKEAVWPQPDHMNDYVHTHSDIGGVHTNSGIMNKAFYLVASQISIPNAGQIYIRALLNYFNDSTNFYEARLGLIESAIDLYGPLSTAHVAIQDAFDAVGITSTAPLDFDIENAQFLSINKSIDQSNNKYTHIISDATMIKVSLGALENINPYDDGIYISDEQGVTQDVFVNDKTPQDKYISKAIIGDTIQIRFSTSLTASFRIDGYYYTKQPIQTVPVIDNNEIVSNFLIGPNPYRINPRSVVSGSRGEFDHKTDQITFQFQLNRPASVTVFVYDLNGELIYKRSKYESPGLKQWSWNINNRFGEQLANGLYHAHLLVEDGQSKAVLKEKLGILR